MIRMPKAKSAAIATLGVDIGRNMFHLVGLDKHGARFPRAVGPQRRVHPYLYE
jgi:hypothetical protein